MQFSETASDRIEKAAARATARGMVINYKELTAMFSLRPHLARAIFLALGVLFLALVDARGQNHEPPGKELHPSYVLYYGPGDGTVRVVDPETGNTGQPIYATSSGQPVWVHWFAYDWPDNRMYVVYSENASGELLLGTADLHSWQISSIAAIDTTADYGLPGDQFDLRGVAYSQVTKSLYMNFGTSVSGLRGIIALDPETAKLIKGDYLGIPPNSGFDSAVLAGHALSNDPAGNVYYDRTNSGYSDGITWYGTAWLAEPGNQDLISRVFPVRASNNNNPDLASISPPYWKTMANYDDAVDLYALAVEPETGSRFVVTGGAFFPKGLSKLRFFTYNWHPVLPVTQHYTYAESVNPSTPVQNSDKGLSLVFVPWQPALDGVP